MVTAVDGIFAAGVVLGAFLCWLGVHTYRARDQLGMGAFAAFVVILGLGTATGGVLATLGVSPASTDDVRFWTQIPVLFWLFSAVPWFIFALQYTGRQTEVRTRTVALLAIPPSGVAFQIVFSTFDVGSTAVLSLLGSLVFVYCAVLMIVGGYLVVETTYTYGHLSVWEGFSLAAVPLGTFLFWNVTGLQVLSATSAGGFYLAGGAAAAVGVSVAFGRYETFDSTPAVGTIGERVIARQTDDIVFVVDDRDRITKLNQTAVESLGVARSDALGVSVEAVLGHGTDDLRPMGTVTLDTERGSRRYDPAVSAVTDQHGRELGFIVSLRDVTERELREQRLAVLNRVLRHNLRNKIEVVKSHAEEIERRHDGEHARSILSTADEIAGLGHSARTIDRFVSATTSESAVDLHQAVTGAVDCVTDDADGVTISVSVPESTCVAVPRAALRAALEEAVDNAVTYADEAVEVSLRDHPEGYQLQVADDGPGIPDGELACLDAGTETALQHGSGLGLWQLKWAVRTIDGDLDFETEDGTTVRIVIPAEADRAEASDRATTESPNAEREVDRQARTNGSDGSDCESSDDADRGGV